MARLARLSLTEQAVHVSYLSLTPEGVTYGPLGPLQGHPRSFGERVESYGLWFHPEVETVSGRPEHAYIL